MRIAYRYFLRDFNVGSVSLLAGALLLSAGVAFGVGEWSRSGETGVTASSGTVMLAALPVLLGFQMLIFALLYDVGMTPRDPIAPYLTSPRRRLMASPRADEAPPPGLARGHFVEDAASGTHPPGGSGDDALR